MSFLAPVAAAVGGSSLLGSVITAAVPALIGGLFGGRDEPDVPAPPAIQTAPTVDPQVAIDEEAARVRALKRRRAASQGSNSLLSLDQELNNNILGV